MLLERLCLTIVFVYRGAEIKCERWLGSGSEILLMVPEIVEGSICGYK